MSLADRIEVVRGRIASTGRDPDEVRLVAVTKGFPAATVRAVVDAGLTDIGENYAQEMLGKVPDAPEVTWHFIGSIQRNKVAALAPIVGWWHGVDREEAGATIAARSPGAKVLVQVNLTGGAPRGGVGWGEVAALVDSLRRQDLAVRGLMGVAVHGDLTGARRQFDRLVAVGRDLGLAEFSIGMSDDLEQAVDAGATMIRVGRALLGDRPRPRRMTG
ncbi:MAG: YggS family pyridoxal phosphate-dependent enzyme [Acidimicrobiales bacterium]